jgi:hypothetical protein
MADMALYARDDGLLEPRAQKSVAFVKSNAGKLIIADISANTRTSLQNRFLNGWIYTKQIADKLNNAGLSLGGSPWARNSVHAAMQSCFLVKETFLMFGIEHTIYESTADMSKARFTEYIKQVSDFVYGQWEITVEDPKEGYWLEIYNEVFNR